MNPPLSAPDTSSPQSPQEVLAQLLAEADHRKYVKASEATLLATQAHALAVSLQDERSQALASIILGGSAFYRSDYPAALQHHLDAHALSRDRFPEVEYRVTSGLSILHHQQGDYAQAMTYALQSLHLVHAMGDLAGEARVLSNMGNMHWEIQEYDRALELHTQAMTRLQEVPQTDWQPAHRAQEAIIRLNTTVAHFHLGHYDQALQESDEVLQQCQALGLHQPEAILRTYRALTLLDLGQVARADEESLQALAMHRAGGDREHEVMTLIVRGRLHLLQGHAEAALAPLSDALTMARNLRLPLRESEAHRWMSTAMEYEQRYAEALDHHKAFYAIQRDLHDLTLDRKTKMLTVEANVLSLRREAELERERRAELEQVNADLRRAQAHVRHLADHDTLTGLPNRKLFTERLEQALKLARRASVRHGVMFIDLDGFKQVNDTWGHSSGDLLLQQVAARLSDVVRDSDTVARFAGDEFVVFAQHTASEEALQVVGDRIVAALRAPFELAGASVHIGASVGYACYPEDAQTVDGLLHCADTAMYQAKGLGKNQTCGYTLPFRDGAIHAGF